MPGTQPTWAVSSPVTNLADPLVSSEITVHFQRGSPPGDILSSPLLPQLPSPPSTPHKPLTTTGQDGSAVELTNPAAVMLNRLPETTLRCGPQCLGGPQEGQGSTAHSSDLCAPSFHQYSPFTLSFLIIPLLQILTARSALGTT